MQSLRDKLISAGLVTDAPKTQEESAAPRKNRKRRSAAPREVAPGTNLELMKLTEAHRVRGDTRGGEEFQYELRDGELRKMLVTREIAHGLTAGRMAIVESGEPGRCLLVHRDAVEPVAAIDPAAIRYFNGDGTQS